MCDYINYKLIKVANQQRIDIFIRILFIEWYYKKMIMEINYMHK